VTELALKVQKAGRELGLRVEVHNLENPRIEKEEHYYHPDHRRLLDLGYQPTHDMDAELRLMLKDLVKYSDRIEALRAVLIPDIRWDGTRRKVEFL
jgi:UDP-sulfoquinovose synthase